MENVPTPDPTCRPDPLILGTAPPDIVAALQVLSGKWTIVILWHLRHGPVRFNALKRAVPDITQHMLTSHLRKLETDGIVTRQIFAEVPPRVEYSLTPHGRTLRPVFEALADWGAAHLALRAAPQAIADQSRT